MNNAMGKLQGRGIVCIRINSKASIEKRVLYVVYVVSIVAYQDSGSMQTSQKGLSHTWD